MFADITSQPLSLNVVVLSAAVLFSLALFSNFGRATKKTGNEDHVRNAKSKRLGVARATKRRRKRRTESSIDDQTLAG
jgi:hypothetical protein